MATQLEQKLRYYKYSYINLTELNALLGGTKNSRYAKIKRAVNNGNLIRIKRGLYAINENISKQKPHPYPLAQLIYNPSYISLESALSYHNLIPEAVYSTTSATFKRAKEFKTPLGIFTYLKIPMKNFFTEVERIVENNNIFLMATPWKAITDYVYCYKKDWNNIEPLIESLRIELEDLPKPSLEILSDLKSFYKSNRIDKFLNGIKKDFKL